MLCESRSGYLLEKTKESNNTWGRVVETGKRKKGGAVVRNGAKKLNSLNG